MVQYVRLTLSEPDPNVIVVFEDFTETNVTVSEVAGVED